MGLYKQYFQIAQHTTNYLTGTKNRNGSNKKRKYTVPVFLVGVVVLIIGILLSSLSLVDYLILKHLELKNGSLSFQYWQKPGVLRLTKVYIFNITNPDGFLNFGHKPKLEEVGPFVYREDMEKVNIKFHDNGTISYQHKKNLQFVPEMSLPKDLKIVVPNIPLLTLTSQTNSLPYFIQKAISLLIELQGMKPFVTVTAGDLVFGYDDPLVGLAHKFYPEQKRPMSRMGLLIARNGTLREVHNIYTGATGMQDFGLLEKLNGLEHFPYWTESPCNVIRASEGSMFPPRYFTKSDIINIYDKDLCRTLPMQYKEPVTKHGIDADLYVPVESAFESASKEPNNKCYCPGHELCPEKGLINISPCQFDAPVYLSLPHFMDADPTLIEKFEGLKPIKEQHSSYMKVQPKFGVPLEAKLRVQLNLKVDRAPLLASVKQFPTITYPIMWLEDGIDNLPPGIQRWLYLATTFADVAVPILSYGMILLGSCMIIAIVINTYTSLGFTQKNINTRIRNLKNGDFLISRPKAIVRQDTYRLLDVHDPNDVC